MTKSRSRSPSRSLAAFVLGALVVACTAVVACAETRRTLGEDCLKSEDCLSGICESLKCAAAPPILGANPTLQPDSGPDAAPEGGDGGTEGGDANDGAPD
jgi:hypothetical protein